MPDVAAVLPGRSEVTKRGIEASATSERTAPGQWQISRPRLFALAIGGVRAHPDGQQYPVVRLPVREEIELVLHPPHLRQMAGRRVRAVDHSDGKLGGHRVPIEPGTE